MNMKYFIIEGFLDDKWAPVDRMLAQDIQHALTKIAYLVSHLGGDIELVRVRSEADSQWLHVEKPYTDILDIL